MVPHRVKANDKERHYDETQVDEFVRRVETYFLKKEACKFH
jgi:hypothetical protein